MKSKLLIILFLLSQTYISSQSSLKLEFGSGNSSISDLSISFNDGRNKGKVNINKARSTIRNIDFDFSEGNGNEGLKFLLGLASANADGINISFQEGLDDLYIDIGRISYSMDDWNIDIVHNDLIRELIMSAKIEMQNFKILPPQSLTDNLNYDQLENYRYISETNGEILIKKMLIDFNLNREKYFDISGTLDLPIGKAKLSALMFLGEDFKENPFFKNLQIDFNQLSSLGRTLMENLTNSSNLPLKRKGAGYSLQMAGFFNDRYNISLSEAEEAAEDAVISAIKAGLESHSTEKLMENGRRSWPTNPWDALETKPAGWSQKSEDARINGEWRFNYSTSNITHMRNNGDLYFWKYHREKGTIEIFNPDATSLYSSTESQNSEMVTLKTKHGDISIKLFPDIAPMHVESFKLHIENGYYNGTIFHRVIPGFMIQVGDPNTKRTNKASYGTGGHAAKYYGIGEENDSNSWTLPAEFSDIQHRRGIVSMARSNDPNSAGSQFFIVTADAPHLNGKYTVFGEVVSGMEIAEMISYLPRDARDNPEQRVEIISTEYSVGLLIPGFEVDFNNLEGYENPESLLNKAESLRKQKRLKESVEILFGLIGKYPENELTPKAQYMLGDIYMNDFRDFALAIEEYGKVLERHSGSEQEPHALFMIGYIHANVLGEQDVAKEKYDEFLNKFPEHELAPSIKFELGYFGKTIDQIPALKHITTD
tara:strand:- start:127 stop:2259 length:2133 start_codon:yes stop_codon:yes gene_type:complete